MSDPIYDLILGNMLNVREPNDPDRNWKSDVSVSKLVETSGSEQTYENKENPDEHLKLEHTLNTESPVVEEKFKKKRILALQ